MSRFARLTPATGIKEGDTVFREYTHEFRVITRIAPVSNGTRFLYYYPPEGDPVEHSFLVYDNHHLVVMLNSARWENLETGSEAWDNVPDDFDDWIEKLP